MKICFLGKLQKATSKPTEAYELFVTKPKPLQTASTLITIFVQFSTCNTHSSFNRTSQTHKLNAALITIIITINNVPPRWPISEPVN